MASRLSAPLESSRQSRPEIERGIKLWPVLALLPVLLAGRLKAAGLTNLAGVDLTLLSVGLVAAATVATFARRPAYPVGRMIPYLVFVLVVGFGLLGSSPGEYQSLKSRDFFLLTGVIAVCVPVLVRDRRDLRTLGLIWFLGGTLVAVLVLTIGGSAELYGRAGIGDDTLGAAYLSAAALVAGGAALGERLLPVPVALLGMALSGIALMEIGSRGPMLGAAVGLTAWALLRGPLRPSSVLVLAAGSAVAAFGLGRASQAAVSRLVLEDPAREELWRNAGELFLQQPFTGIGWGDYATTSWIANYPHNMFLEAASELGLAGLIAILALVLTAMVRVWASRTAPEVRVLAAVASVILVGQQFSSDLTSRVFWVALIPCLLLPLPAALDSGPRRMREPAS